MTASQARAALLSGIANASDGNVHIDGIYSGGELTGYKVVRLVRENYGAQREEILFQSRCADTFRAVALKALRLTLDDPRAMAAVEVQE